MCPLMRLNVFAISVSRCSITHALSMTWKWFVAVVRAHTHSGMHARTQHWYTHASILICMCIKYNTCQVLIFADLIPVCGRSPWLLFIRLPYSVWSLHSASVHLEHFALCPSIPFWASLEVSSSHIHCCYLVCNILVVSSHHMAIPRNAFRILPEGGQDIAAKPIPQPVPSLEKRGGLAQNQIRGLLKEELRYSRHIPDKCGGCQGCLLSLIFNLENIMQWSREDFANAVKINDSVTSAPQTTSI